MSKTGSDSYKRGIIMIPSERIISRIFLIRGKKVMIDRDLAELYEVGTKVLNLAVKRNIDRFPNDFMFQLNNEEFENWKSQMVISNYIKMGMRKKPRSRLQVSRGHPVLL